VDVSDSEPASDSDASPANAKGYRRTLRGNNIKSKAAAAPPRRQPSRTAAAKVSLAEANSDSSLDTSSSSDEADKGSNRKRTGLSGDKAAVKRQKAVIEDSDCSMGDAANTHKELGLVSDSEAVSDEESDKENQPASPEAAAVKYISQPLVNLKLIVVLGIVDVFLRLSYCGSCLHHSSSFSCHMRKAVICTLCNLTAQHVLLLTGRSLPNLRDIACVCEQAYTDVEALSRLQLDLFAVLRRTFKRAARQVPTKQKQAQAKVGCSNLST